MDGRKIRATATVIGLSLVAAEDKLLPHPLEVWGYPIPPLPDWVIYPIVGLDLLIILFYTTKGVMRGIEDLIVGFYDMRINILDAKKRLWKKQVKEETIRIRKENKIIPLPLQKHLSEAEEMTADEQEAPQKKYQQLAAEPGKIAPTPAAPTSSATWWLAGFFTREPAKGHKATYAQHKNRVTTLAWSPDGKKIIFGCADRSFWTYDRESGEPTRSQGHPEQITSFIWNKSEEGRIIACGYSHRKVQLWEAMTQTLLLEHHAHRKRVTALALSPDGQHIASGGDDKKVFVYTKADQEVCVSKEHTSVLHLVAWSPQGDRIASSAADGEIDIWAALDPQKTLFTYRGHARAFDGQAVSALAWSPDGTQIASAGDQDNHIHVWSPAEQEADALTLTYERHREKILALAWDRDGQRIVSVSGNHPQVWDTVTGDYLFTYRGHKHEVTHVVWSPGGEEIASACSGRTVQVWEPRNV